jgi:hypothetical protein
MMDNWQKNSVRPLKFGDFSSWNIPKINKKGNFYAIKWKRPFHRVNGGRQFTQKLRLGLL